MPGYLFYQVKNISLCLTGRGLFHAKNTNSGTLIFVLANLELISISNTSLKKNFDQKLATF